MNKENISLHEPQLKGNEESYLKDCIRGLALTYASNEFKENYFLDILKLQEYSGFILPQDNLNKGD